MDFENKYNAPDSEDAQPSTQGHDNLQPESGHPQPPAPSPASDAAYPQTPFQVPVRSSQDAPPPPYEAPASQQPHDHPIYHDQAHTEASPPFEPGTQSYATYQEWQAQHAKSRLKKPRSKKPFLVLGGVAVAAALFFGGMAIGGGGGSLNPADSSNANLPTVSISSPPSGGKAKSADGTLSGEEIYSKLNPSVVAIQSANANGQTASSGSGVVMSSDGYIITNAHVITDENTGAPMASISVLLSDGSQMPAQIRGYDQQTDLAVVKVEPKTALVPAEFGDSDALQVGEAAYAIGSPGGVELANSMTNGIISAINRDITVNDRVMSLIQTNVTINPGNSGGALINQYGQVVGITSAKLGISYYEGLGFAIPINSAKEIVDQLIQNGYIVGRPTIGITGRNVTEQLAQYRNLPQGVEVASVDSRANAASEGLQAGDIITAVNGKAITTMNEINDIKSGLKAGDTLTLTVYRPSAQKALDLRITLTDAHDLEGSDPAQQTPQQYEQPQNPGNGSRGGSGGSFDPFQYFFGN